LIEPNFGERRREKKTNKLKLKSKFQSIGNRCVGSGARKRKKEFRDGMASLINP